MSQEKMLVETTLEMLGPYILMRRDRPEERKSPGGIVLPAKGGETPTWGTAVIVGDEAAIRVAPGDRMLVGRYAGNEVKVGEEALVVVRLEDVYGIERGDAPRSAEAALLNG